MWKGLSLRARILTLLAALISTTLAGGLVTLWHNEAMDSLLASLVEQNMASFQAAEELENSLLRQKGFLTYYFLDGNPKWLKEIDKNNLDFNIWLKKARKSASTAPMEEILGEIDGDYQQYLKARQYVIDLYREGKKSEGARLHWQVRGQYVNLLDLCARYKLMHEYAISRARTESQARARFINAFALVAILAVGILGVLLAYILLKQILGPIRQLARETAPAHPSSQAPNEVTALSHRVHSLMEDMGQAQIELERSQEHLAQAEKWVLVGKLAAGAAHSIRNPLTSVKMRLWSMNRSVDLNVPEREDLEAISEEIRHIDTIVSNFLQFSRPQKLMKEKISPSEVVDQALKIMKNRLHLYGVQVKLDRRDRLPEIMADSEQLREVLVNLMVNACEAMVGGGELTIQEEEGDDAELGRVAILKVTDTGPGIAPAIQDQVFHPFFSTKEEGTGLGLAIANRIVKDHGGRLELHSREGRGATFIITLPFLKDQAWATS
ncbi:MAG: ATP-binding protein [Syntrophales bacterium]|nr:ATP-binding protein [Syntrophales bacterium]MDD5642132.1 ATP-binding protein [Syntrophales bacterium]